MKSICSLRLLSLFGFLLLIAPFYDHCNGQRIKKVATDPQEVILDTTAVEILDIQKNNLSIEKDTIINTEIYKSSIIQNIYEFIDDSNSENAFEIGIICESYFDITFREFKTELVKEIKKDYRVITFHIKNICFLFIILFSTSILFLSFLKKTKIIHQFSKINLFLLLITIICILFFDPLFETYKQIKWGYYAFALVQLWIYYSSKSEIRNLKS